MFDNKIFVSQKCTETFFSNIVYNHTKITKNKFSRNSEKLLVPSCKQYI